MKSSLLRLKNVMNMRMFVVIYKEHWRKKLRILLSKYNEFYHICILVMIIGLSFWGIEFESVIFKYTCYVAYFIYSLYFIYYLYNSKSIYNYSSLIVSLPFIYFMLLFVDKILIIPFIPICFVVAIKKVDSKYTKVAVMSLYTFIIGIGVLVFVVSSFFNDFSSERVERVYYSPNKQKSITVITVDLGATGGGTKTYKERSYFGLLKLKRKILTGRLGEIPQVNWVDNSSVHINEKIIKVR